MKLFFFILALMLSSLTTLHADTGVDCLAMISEFQGKPSHVNEPVSIPGTIVSCNLVDYGTAIRSDYQAHATGAPTDQVTQVKSNVDGSPLYAKALQKYYGARGLSLLATCGKVQGNGCVPNSDGEQGISLFAKFSTAVQAEYPMSPDLVNYITGDLTKANSPQGVPGDYGSCQIWSAWSLDPDVQAMLAKVGDGIFCGGVPFTKGELRELITTTYPDPQYLLTTKTSDPNSIQGKNVLTGYNNSAPEDLKEEANLALAKLGAFGNNGEFTPGQIIQKAAAAKQAGDHLIMDLDPGTIQVWNQPIEAVLDVEYLNSSMSAHDLESNLTGADLGPANSTIVNDIKYAEAEIKTNALKGSDALSPSLLALRNLLVQNGFKESPVGQEDLLDQAAELKSIQQAFLDHGDITPVANQVTQHRIFIKYAKEATFAQNHPETMKSEVRALDYTTVNGRSSWTPPTENLSQACQTGDLGTRVSQPGFGLVQSNILSQCSQLQSGRIQDHPIATGAFPPKEIDVFDQSKADALNKADMNSSALTEKQKLYNHLRDMILNCDKGPNGAPTFDTAATFLNDFDNTVKQNVVTPADQARLKQEYLNAQAFLDPPASQIPANPDPNVEKDPSIQDDLAQHLQDLGVSDPNQIPGLSALYQSLSL